MGGSWVLDLLRSLGYVGIALLMCLENLFPPIPSELIMPVAGVLAAQGDLSLPGVIAAGSVGSLAGQAAWYWLGRRVGERRLRRYVERRGRWLTVAPGEVDRARDWLVRHGVAALLIGRLVPTIRTLISLPAGLARVSPWRFLLYSGIGTSIWTGVLAVAGYALQSRFTRVNDILGPISTTVVVMLVGWYLWRIATHRSTKGERRWPGH